MSASGSLGDVRCAVCVCWARLAVCRLVTTCLPWRLSAAGIGEWDERAVLQQWLGAWGRQLDEEEERERRAADDMAAWGLDAGDAAAEEEEKG
jgi:hypothetical protein